MSEEEKGTELELFAKGSNKYIGAAQQYCLQLNLPPEAASAVLRAAQAAKTLSNIVAKQKKLDSDKRKALLGSKNPLSSSMLEKIDDLVDEIGVPYNLLSVIEGKPYIKAEGIRALFQADPRIPKACRVEQIEVPQIEGNFIVGMKAIVEFYNGCVYEDFGFCDQNELQTRRSRSEAPPAFVGMIAKTRAERRAIRSAISLPIGVAEDAEEGRELEAGPTIVEIRQSAPPEARAPKNKAQLLAWGMSTCDMKQADIVEVLGVSDLSEITDFEDAWRKVENHTKPR